MGNCTLHFIQWYAAGIAGASEGEGKNGGGKIFWHAAFLQPVISHSDSVAFVWISSLERSQICINCWCDLNCKLHHFIVEEFHFFFFFFHFFHSVCEFSPHTRLHRADADRRAWWRCLRLPSDPVWACKSQVSPLIMACHLYLGAQAASSLSFPSQRPWLLSCCLTLNKRLHVVH